MSRGHGSFRSSTRCSQSFFLKMRLLWLGHKCAESLYLILKSPNIKKSDSIIMTPTFTSLIFMELLGPIGFSF